MKFQKCNCSNQGFGVSNVNKNNEEDSDEETEADELDILLRDSLKNLEKITKSLYFKTKRITGQGVIMSSRFEGHRFFTNLSDLSRCLNNFNLYKAERVEKPLNRAILAQYKYTVALEEDVPIYIRLKVSYE